MLGYIKNNNMPLTCDVVAVSVTFFFGKRLNTQYSTPLVYDGFNYYDTNIRHILYTIQSFGSPIM